MRSKVHNAREMLCLWRECGITNVTQSDPHMGGAVRLEHFTFRQQLCAILGQQTFDRASGATTLVEVQVGDFLPPNFWQTVLCDILYAK